MASEPRGIDYHYFFSLLYKKCTAAFAIWFLHDWRCLVMFLVDIGASFLLAQFLMLKTVSQLCPFGHYSWTICVTDRAELPVLLLRSHGGSLHGRLYPLPDEPPRKMLGGQSGSQSLAKEKETRKGMRKKKKVVLSSNMCWDNSLRWKRIEEKQSSKWGKRAPTVVALHFK